MSGKINKSKNTTDYADPDSLIDNDGNRAQTIQGRETDEIDIYNVDEMLEKAGGFGKTQLLTLIACIIWYQTPSKQRSAWII